MAKPVQTSFQKTRSNRVIASSPTRTKEIAKAVASKMLTSPPRSFIPQAEKISPPIISTSKAVDAVVNGKAVAKAIAARKKGSSSSDIK